jgi:hypothetical protein
MGYNQKYKQYKRDGGTKSFKEFAEMENAIKISSNEFNSQDSVLQSIFEQPKTEQQIAEENTTSIKVNNVNNKVFGINKNLFYLSSALLVIAIASVAYKKYLKK